MVVNNRRLLETIIESLQLLAADYQIQVGVLPDFVCIPDEVISPFSNAYLLIPQIAADGLLNSQQIDALRNIDILLDEMTANEDQDIWSLEAMESGADWAHLRDLARDALALFGRQPSTPNLNWIVYVGRKKN